MLGGASDLVFIENSVCLVFSIYAVILSGLVSAFKAYRGHPHGAVHIICMLNHSACIRPHEGRRGMLEG